jgi:hypothetical protein
VGYFPAHVFLLRSRCQPGSVALSPAVIDHFHEDPMADHAEAAVTGSHPEMDYREHERTYQRFLTFTKWAIAHILVILILMAIFLL